jgi:hypothetical protein
MYAHAALRAVSGSDAFSTIGPAKATAEAGSIDGHDYAG